MATAELDRSPQDDDDDEWVIIEGGKNTAISTGDVRRVSLRREIYSNDRSLTRLNLNTNRHRIERRKGSFWTLDQRAFPDDVRDLSIDDNKRDRPCFEVYCFKGILSFSLPRLFA